MATDLPLSKKGSWYAGLDLNRKGTGDRHADIMGGRMGRAAVFLACLSCAPPAAERGGTALAEAQAAALVGRWRTLQRQLNSIPSRVSSEYYQVANQLGEIEAKLRSIAEGEAGREVVSRAIDAEKEKCRRMEETARREKRAIETAGRPLQPVDLERIRQRILEIEALRKDRASLDELGQSVAP